MNGLTLLLARAHGSEEWLVRNKCYSKEQALQFMIGWIQVEPLTEFKVDDGTWWRN